MNTFLRSGVRENRKPGTHFHYISYLSFGKSCKKETMHGRKKKSELLERERGAEDIERERPPSGEGFSILPMAQTNTSRGMKTIITYIKPKNN